MFLPSTHTLVTSFRCNTERLESFINRTHLLGCA